jgi:hypothetical protein
MKRQTLVAILGVTLLIGCETQFPASRWHEIEKACGGEGWSRLQFARILSTDFYAVLCKNGEVVRLGQ